MRQAQDSCELLYPTSTLLLSHVHLFVHTLLLPVSALPAMHTGITPVSQFGPFAHVPTMLSILCAMGFIDHQHVYAYTVADIVLDSFVLTTRLMFCDVDYLGSCVCPSKFARIPSAGFADRNYAQHLLRACGGTIVRTTTMSRCTP